MKYIISRKHVLSLWSEEWSTLVPGYKNASYSPDVQHTINTACTTTTRKELFVCVLQYGSSSDPCVVERCRSLLFLGQETASDGGGVGDGM